MNIKSQLLDQLRDKPYRDAYVASQLRIGLPMQCRALRESRGWTQPKLAEAAEMSQPRISEIERPGERKLNLETLLRLASAFDVALQVRFVTFERLVDDDNHLDLDHFYVAPFEENVKQMEKREEQMNSVLFMNMGRSSLENDLRGSDNSTDDLDQTAGIRPIVNIINRQLIGVGGKQLEPLGSIAS